jgi:membrane protease YdiL (CAAX protease family)
VTVLELLLVLGLPTSLFFAGSLRWLAHNTGNPYVSDARVASTLVFELALAALLLPFLRRRGWRPGQVAGTPEPRDVLRGAGVWLAAMASYYLTWIVFTLSAPTLARAIHHGPTPGVHVSAVMIVVVAVLNPLFEEFLWLGYGIPALSSRLGLRGASVVSVALRVAVHIYQGAQGIIGILPVAIVFTRYYARTRRIWPVVVAHVIADALAFALVSMR